MDGSSCGLKDIDSTKREIQVRVGCGVRRGAQWGFGCGVCPGACLDLGCPRALEPSCEERHLSLSASALYWPIFQTTAGRADLSLGPGAVGGVGGVICGAWSLSLRLHH